MKYSVYNYKTVFGTRKLLFWPLLIFFISQCEYTFGQNDTTRSASRSVATGNDTIIIQVADSLKILDTTTAILNRLDIDTIRKESNEKNAITSKVEYSAVDSLSLDLENKKAFMYKDANIKYEKINQKAAYIEIDFQNNTLTAQPSLDSLGKTYGQPEFTEGDQSFKSKEMRYNFRTRKGIIKNVITKEGEGYLHGEVVKKMQNDISNMRFGGYTTCNLEDPHFSLKFTKAKVIPGNKIVTGPAYMTIEDVPIPIVLPFGLFPNKRGQTSGVVIPTYGESNERGFYLENGGYYLGINEYMELRLVGDIFSRGSWAVKPVFNYRKRYKYNGSFNFNYAINTSGIRETPEFLKKRDFKIAWSHRQDAKARPHSQFSASVNFGSSTFNRYNPVSVQDHLTNTFGSSISYSTNFGERVSLTTALRHTQNTSNKTINLTLPEIALSVSRFYPLRRPGKVSNFQWYDNISVNYSMNARNEVNTYDSLLFTNYTVKNFKNGVIHKVPVNLSLKVLKFFTLSSSVDYNERWYSASITKSWVDDTLFRKNDTIVGYVRIDTITGFKAARDFGFSSSLNTSLYGLVQFKKGPIRAIRHVLRPSISFSLRPDFANPRYGYYREVQSDTLGRITQYSIFGDDATYSSVYGSPPSGRSGRVGFSFNNNLEMKVRSKSDTITGTKKIMLLESFTLGTSYDLARDSLQWSPLLVSARTTLFEKLQIQYSATFSPYQADSTGRAINKFEWDANRRLFRLDNSSWNFSLSYSFGSSTKNKPSNQNLVAVPEEEAKQIVENPYSYINWNNTWNFSFSYNLRYNDLRDFQMNRMKHTLVQTLGFNGDVNITPKWKVNFTSGYDFESNKLSYTSFSVYRDLHCWEMRFNWIPMGYMKSWNFYIKVKASILQDLKLNRKKDFRDN